MLRGRPLAPLALSAVFAGLAPPAAALQAETPSSEIDRGRYLVHQVAMCVQCHSPRDGSGNLLEGRLLEGGAIPVDSPYTRQVWGFHPPRLRGLPGWETEDFVSLLTTGRRLDGRSPRPLMPPFRLTPGDARAVASYLRSLDAVAGDKASWPKSADDAEEPGGSED